MKYMSKTRRILEGLAFVVVLLTISGADSLVNLILAEVPIR